MCIALLPRTTSFTPSRTNSASALCKNRELHSAMSVRQQKVLMFSWEMADLLPSYLHGESDPPSIAVWCTMSCRQPAKPPTPNTAALQRSSVAFCCPGLRLKAQLLAPHSRIFCLISYQTGLSLCRLPRALNPANTAHVILVPVPKYTVTPLTKGTEQPQLPAGSHWSDWEPQLPRTPEKWLSPLGDQGSCHQPQQTHLRAAATHSDTHKPTGTTF